MKVLDVQGLNVQYHTEKTNASGAGDAGSGTLHGVSFSVGEGEIVGLVGESGSGKSTAMLAVLGLLGGKADVSFERISLCGEAPAPGRNAAMVFQDAQSCLNPTVKIGRQITETIRARRGCGRKEARERAEELLDLVGIHNAGLRMKQYPFELSGGMRQRVVIAVALACEPKLIIADEPTTALDAAVQAQIILLLKRIVRETGTSLLLVSHDMGVTAALCSRVYVMRQGRIIESGTAEEIFYSPREAYTRQLLRDAKGIRRPSAGREERKPLLEIRHLTKEFDTMEGIRDVSLEIFEGEVFALAGESGSGKTTLARILSGILTEDSGEVLYRGGRLERDRSGPACGGKIQMVFQDPYAALNPCLTAGQALEEALRGAGRIRRKEKKEHQGGQQGSGGQGPEKQSRGEKQSPREMQAQQEQSRAQIRERIGAVLELVGLRREDADRYPREFSGGQRQRIGIARALITEPELLICDEALSSLDAGAREQILALLLEIQKKRGISCLFISHDMHVVRQISDRIGVMYGGSLVETGRTREVCSDPWHPYTKQLIEAVPEPDPLKAAKLRSAPVKETPVKEARSRLLFHKRRPPAGCPFAGRCGYALECCASEAPGSRKFGSREIRCFLYSEEHSGRRSEGYEMTSQI